MGEDSRGGQDRRGITRVGKGREKNHAIPSVEPSGDAGPHPAHRQAAGRGVLVACLGGDRTPQADAAGELYRPARLAGQRRRRGRGAAAGFRQGLRLGPQGRADPAGPVHQRGRPAGHQHQRSAGRRHGPGHLRHRHRVLHGGQGQPAREQPGRPDWRGGEGRAGAGGVSRGRAARGRCGVVRQRPVQGDQRQAQGPGRVRRRPRLRAQGPAGGRPPGEPAGGERHLLQRRQRP